MIPKTTKKLIGAAFGVATSGYAIAGLEYEQCFTGQYTGYGVSGGFLFAAITRTMPVDRIQLSGYDGTSRIFDIKSFDHRAVFSDPDLSTKDMYFYAMPEELGLKLSMLSPDKTLFVAPFNGEGTYTVTYNATLWRMALDSAPPIATKMKYTPKL